MDEKLYLLQMDHARELENDLLREHTETLALPPNKLCLIFTYSLTKS